MVKPSFCVSENTFYKDTAVARSKKLKTGEYVLGNLGKDGLIFGLFKYDDGFGATIYNPSTKSFTFSESNQRVNALKKVCKDAGVSIVKDSRKNTAYQYHQSNGGNYYG